MRTLHDFARYCRGVQRPVNQRAIKAFWGLQGRKDSCNSIIVAKPAFKEISDAPYEALPLFFLHIIPYLLEFLMHLPVILFRANQLDKIPFANYAFRAVLINSQVEFLQYPLESLKFFLAAPKLFRFHDCPFNHKAAQLKCQKVPAPPAKVMPFIHYYYAVLELLVAFLEKCHSYCRIKEVVVIRNYHISLFSKHRAYFVRA